MKKLFVLFLAALLLCAPAMAADAPGGTLMVQDGDENVLGNEEIGRDQVKSVSFLSSLSGAPEDAWDASEKQDRSVLAWVEPMGEDYYSLTIAADGPVRFNKDSSGLFFNFSGLEQINFGNVADTSNVTNMYGMFGSCERLTELDVSGFDTANVTDMGWMFGTCESLTKLDVTGFDTGNVTNMNGMFALCGSLKSLDLSGFTITDGTDTDDMFLGCDALTDLKMPE